VRTRCPPPTPTCRPAVHQLAEKPRKHIKHCILPPCHLETCRSPLPRPLHAAIRRPPQHHHLTMSASTMAAAAGAFDPLLPAALRPVLKGFAEGYLLSTIPAHHVSRSHAHRFTRPCGVPAPARAGSRSVNECPSILLVAAAARPWTSELFTTSPGAAAVLLLLPRGYGDVLGKCQRRC